MGPEEVVTGVVGAGYREVVPPSPSFAMSTTRSAWPGPWCDAAYRYSRTASARGEKTRNVVADLSGPIVELDERTQVSRFEVASSSSDQYSISKS